MPHLEQKQAMALIARRHPEWEEQQKHWRWLQDSYEGGERYRHADYFRGPFDEAAVPWYGYGWDATTGELNPISYDQIVERNLVPHKSETDPRNRDIYALRLNRTAVPALVAKVLRRYLARIYSRQVKRTGPAAVQSWWDDVDGRGTDVKKWMRKKVAPLLLSVGHLDLVFAHPEVPEGPPVETRADMKALGLKGVVASYILPENMAWWVLDAKGRYSECLVHERYEGQGYWRHWTATDSNCYAGDGTWVAARSYEHNFGRPPIVRVFDEQVLRHDNSGKSRMETVAYLQKSVYNRESELVLSDVMQSHPILQLPEPLTQTDGMISTGPSGVLPMVKGEDGGFHGSSYIDPPKSGAIECRQHAQDDREEVLSEAGLLKPAGMTRGSTVAQSGISKVADQTEGNEVLSEVADTLAEAEEAAASMALLVASDGKVRPGDEALIEVQYPGEFALFTADDLSSALSDIQSIAASLGFLPETEGELLKRLIAVLLPGITEDRLAELHTEVDTMVKAGAARRAAGQLPAPKGSVPTVPIAGTTQPVIPLPRDVQTAVEQRNRQTSNDTPSP